MKIVYMGTPQFAVAPLHALAKAGHDIVAVVTRIDKPAGRGRAMAEPAVKAAARELGIAVVQPKRVREASSIETLRRIMPDAVVVAAYGQILPKEILTLPRYGCINIHASLLPKGRGAAPINWAIIRGEAETGVTIMQMDEGMDTGGILMQDRLPVDPRDTAGTMMKKLSELGAKMIVEVLPLVETGKLAPVPQDDHGATMAPLLTKQDGLVDWNRPAYEIHNRVRGLSPWPGAFTFLEGRLVKLIETEVVDGSGDPGTIYLPGKDLFAVGTGSGLVRVITVQPEGKRPMSAAEFLRGHRNVVGKKFEKPEKP